MARLKQIRITAKDFERAAQYPEAWREAHAIIGAPYHPRTAPQPQPGKKRENIPQRISRFIAGLAKNSHD